MKVVAVSGDRKGDRGKYLGTNGGRPPCHVEWEDFGQGWWVEWHDVEIADTCPPGEDSSSGSDLEDSSEKDDTVSNRSTASVSLLCSTFQLSWNSILCHNQKRCYGD
jgi:hypothetical protein